MFSTSTITCFLSFLSIISLSLGQYDSPCPLLGPDFPAPSSPASSNAIKGAIQTMNDSLKNALVKATIYGQLDPNTTSFSVNVYSTHEDTSLFTYHYSAPGLAHPSEGVATVDSNTVYRIGSISKLLTVYNFLIAVGDVSFNEPITKYVPELSTYATKNAAILETDDIDTFNWVDITVGALASQLSGIVRDFSLSPASEAPLEKIGFPPFPATNIAYCGDPVQGQLPCNRTGFFQDILSEHPVVAPFYTPIYSNIAYQILSYALETMTSKSFVTSFRDNLINSLHLNATSYAMPAESSASIIPFNATASWYNANILDETPAGGYYTTINDLRRIGISMLNFELLSLAQTRRWMKPHTFTSDPDISVGAPWEIIRAPINRTSWMYTKNGDIGLYSGEFVLLPEYDVGFTVLAAGASSTQTAEIVSDMLAATFLPALEAAAKEEAQSTFAGTYTDSGSKSSLTVVTDDNPGLGITSWTENGTDILPGIGALLGATADQKVSIRLYPSGLKSKDRTKIAWRAVYEALPQPLDPGAFSTNCITWSAVDSLIYGGVGWDEWLFNMNVDGTQALSIEPRVLKTQLQKSNGGNRKMVRREWKA